jgi:hypothetical protein
MVYAVYSRYHNIGEQKGNFVFLLATCKASLPLEANIAGINSWHSLLNE